MQMVDRHQGQPIRPGDGLRSRETDEQGADQPRPLRDGDGIQALELGVRLRQSFPQHGHDQLEMTP